jgi:hypothetical protein
MPAKRSGTTSKRTTRRSTSKRKVIAKLKYRISVDDGTHDKTVYEGVDWNAARAAIDATRSNPSYRKLTLRIRSFNGKAAVMNKHTRIW